MPLERMARDCTGRERQHMPRQRPGIEDIALHLDPRCPTPNRVERHRLARRGVQPRRIGCDVWLDRVLPVFETIGLQDRCVPFPRGIVGRVLEARRGDRGANFATQKVGLFLASRIGSRGQLHMVPARARELGLDI